MFDFPAVEEVVVHISSYHAESNHNYNEHNLGIGLRLKHPSQDKQYVIGTYNNSLYNQSYYAGVYKTAWKNEVISVGYIMGGVIGYDTLILPLLLPESHISIGPFSLIVNWLPSVWGSPEVYGFTLGYKFR